MTPYGVGRAALEVLEGEAIAAGRALADLPGVGSGPQGLTPDAVKASPAYRAARASFEQATAAAHHHRRAFTREHGARYRADIRAERDARRAANKAQGLKQESPPC